MKLSRVAAGVAVAGLLIGSSLPDASAGPPRKPLGQMTCADFLGLDDAVKPEIVYWAAIHGQGGRLGVDVIDVGDTDRVVPLLVEQCKGTPRDSFWRKVRAEAERFEKRL
jgi:acid stress chaperone HdeA